MALAGEGGGIKPPNQIPWNFYGLNLGHMLTLATIIGGGYQTIQTIQSGQERLEYRLVQVEEKVKDTKGLELRIQSVEFRVTAVEQSIVSGRADRVRFQDWTRDELQKLRDGLADLKGQLGRSR